MKVSVELRTVLRIATPVLNMASLLLSQNISQAKKAKVDVWTAVQAYNFGSSYIDYVADHGGENCIELPKITLKML